MQLSFNHNTPNFGKIMIAPSGYKSFENTDKELHLGVRSYIEDQAELRKDDKYVDGIVTGIPDENGQYWPVLNIYDKVTGELLRSQFDVKTFYGRYGYHDCYSKDGRLMPRNVVMLTDVKGKTRYFTYKNESNAGSFSYYSDKNKNLEVQIGVLERMEDYYERSFDKGEIPKDKYATLMMDYNKKYDEPLNKIVPGIINEDNLLGKGREKDVYKIPDMPDYVLCVVRDKYNPNEPISPFYQCFQTNDITDKEEPIMMNDNGMFVKEYTTGKSHSLPNWFDKFHGKEPLTYDDVNLFISQLEDLSAFPTKSYVNFAKKLQKYNAEEIRIDTVNPNNLLIDSEFKSIDIIDVTSEDNKATKYMKRPINGLSDMEALLLDSMMFKSYYDMANDWDKVKLDKCAKTIIDKCVTAEKSANLGNCTENTKTYLESIDNKMPMEDGSTRKGRFEEFLQHFNGIIPEEYKDPKKVFQMNLYGHVIS